MRNRSLAPSSKPRWWFLALLAIAAFANPQSSYAHPMGNFSISHYTGIHVEPTYIELRYIIDMAEIPTYQEIQDTGIVPKAGSPGLDAYLARKAEFLARGLTLEVNGRLLPLRPVSQSVIFPPGAGGLPTMKLGFVYRGAIEGLSPYTVHYHDDNFPGRAGWKEIVIPAQPGFALTASSAPSTDRSSELSNYPTDLLNSPPQALEASFSFSPTPVSAGAPPLPQGAPRSSPSPAISAKADDTSGGQVPSVSHLAAKPWPSVRPDAAPAKESAAVKSSNVSTTAPAPSAAPLVLRANQGGTPRSKFTELISARNPGFWFLFTAALLAAGLGALHALEPGHGKTIVAAYLVGSKGTARHAIWLGLIVTLAHTAGVYLLGILTLYASRYIVPDQLYPWLEMLSGMVIAVVACFLLVRTWTGESGEHSHDGGVGHSHWFAALRGLGGIQPREAQPIEFNPARSADPTEAGSGAPEKTVSLTQLLSLGISGGIVPCPAALVVLLSALSLHRVGFGLFLIVAFSLGLAAVLIASGLLMVYARQLLARWKTDGPFVKRWLPLASATFMLILGLIIAGRALIKTTAATNLFAHGTLPSFVGVVFLGLFLGMRHSTDPDHVIAVSTIASRERSVSQGALIGVLWGVGHTLTIFLVGSAIILFGLVIPPRVGLSMEFSVALMLIFLGVLNLTGALRWLNSRFSPANRNDPSPRALAASNAPAGSLDRLLSRYGAYQVFRPLVIGLVHGLAGSAAVALLVLSTIHTPLWAIAYLLVFGIGTIIGMMLMTSAMAIPVAYTGKHFAAANRYLTPISGIVSTAFGLVLLYQVGFVDGLFRANVHWTPQ